MGDEPEQEALLEIKMPDEDAWEATEGRSSTAVNFVLYDSSAPLRVAPRALAIGTEGGRSLRPDRQATNLVIS